MPATIDLHLRRNKTLIYDGIAQRRVEGVLEPIDLTGNTIRLIVRRDEGEDPVMFEIVSGSPTSDGSIVLDADQVANKGKYVLTIEAAATDDESEFPDDAPAYYPFEIELTELGKPFTLAYGTVKYSPDVR